MGGGDGQGEAMRGKKGGLGLCDPRAVIGCTNLKHWKVGEKKLPEDRVKYMVGP
jgi:hypothetical protein